MNTRNEVMGEHSGRLRAVWRRYSRDCGWEAPQEWWSPAVDAVVRAVVDEGDLADACTRLGHERARAGIAIGVALRDLRAMSRAAGLRPLPFDLLTVLAEGWVDGARAGEDCRDPLTGLVVPGYLRTRVSEIYRGSDAGRPPESTHRLLVVALDPGMDPWRRTARLIVLGDTLRAYFVGAETIALLSRDRIGVLAARTADLPERTAFLGSVLRTRYQARLWHVELPATYTEAVRLLYDIAGTPDPAAVAPR